MSSNTGRLGRYLPMLALMLSSPGCSMLCRPSVNEAPKVEISRRLLEPIRPLPALPVDSFLLPDSGTGPPGPPSSIDAKQGQRTH